MRRKLTAWLLAAAMIFSLMPAALAAGPAQPTVEITPYNGEVSQSVLDQLKGDRVRQLEVETYQDDEVVKVIVELKGRPLLDANMTASALTTDQKAISMRKSLLSQQAVVEDKIEALLGEGQSLTVSYNYTATLNGMALEVPYGALEEIRRLPEVASVTVDHPFDLPEDQISDTAQPNTATAGEMTGVPDTWLDGYTGEGMVVAVIDTGLDSTHPAFQAAPANPRLSTEDVDQILDKLHASERYPGLSSRATYISEKIPFAFNYIDADLNTGHNQDRAGDHGTHVAGIVAANQQESTSVVGAAPDAQLVIMKVFGAKGGAYPTDVVAAIEDAVLLGVDVINMSLGSNGGFNEEGTPYATAIQRATEAGVMVCCSAGNNHSSAFANSTGVNLPYAENMDNGIVGSPSTVSGAISVASVNNTQIHANGFLVNERAIATTDTGASFGLESFIELSDENDGTYQYVVVPGVGAPEDFEKVDVTGKIAVVLRGGLSFSEKHNNAVNAGAIATIVRNNQGEMLNMDLSGVEAGVTQPCVLITQGSGEYMVAQADAAGHVSLTVKRELLEVTAEDGYIPSDFSSWGVLPDLTLKPSLAGVGGNIYSTRNNGTYGSLSGTSMAAPQVAGMSALLLQYVHDSFPNLTKAQARSMAETLLMSTAKPSVQSDGLPYSPRKQGAGLASVAGAVETPAYLSVKGSDQPKAELGDDPDRTGAYSFDFTVTNISDEALQYLTSASLLTETAKDGLMMEWARSLETKAAFTVDGENLDYQYDLDGNGKVDTSDVRYLLAAVNAKQTAAYEAFCDFDANGAVDGKDVDLFLRAVNGGNLDGFDVYAVVVDVPANGSRNITVSINLTKNDRAYMEQNFENGIYVEGYVSLNGVGVTDLSLPLLAFYGDWTQAPLFDTTYAAEIDATSNDGSIIGNNPRYPFAILTGSNTYLGMNPYARDESYIPTRSNALSLSNKDGSTIENVYFDLLRGARNLKISFVDAKGKTLYESSVENVSKSAYDGTYQEMLPTVHSWKDATFGFDPKAYGLGQDDTFTMVVTADKDYEGQYKTETLEFPVYIDAQAPELLEGRSNLDPTTGKRELTVTVQDDHYVSGLVLLSLDAENAIASVDVNQEEPGAASTITFDVAELVPYTGGKFLLGIGDYAQNLSLYEVNVLFEGETSVLADNTFYGHCSTPGDTYDTGWRSFQADNLAGMDNAFSTYIGFISGAELVGDYIFATGSLDTNLLYAIDSATFESHYVAQLGFEINNDKVLDMAYDYENDYLYLLANANWEDVLLRVDPFRETVENLGPVDLSSLDYPGAAYALACSAVGQLYMIAGAKESEDWDAAEMAVLCKLSLDGETPAATQVADLGLPLSNSVMSATIDPETDILYFTYYTAVYDWMSGTKQETGAFYQMEDLDGSLKLSKLGDVPGSQPLDALFMTKDRKVSFSTEAAVTQMTLSDHDLYLQEGSSRQLFVLDVRPWFADVSNYQLNFFSSNPSVATVDADGMVQGVAEGNATITVTATRAGYPTISETCDVTVKSAPGLAGLLRSSEDDKWVEFPTEAPWTMTSLDQQMTLTGTAGAYAVQAGPEGQDVIYVLDDGTANEGAITLYTYDAETMELIGQPSAIRTNSYVPATDIPADGFTDASYDPSSGYIMAVWGHQIYAIDPATNTYYRSYDTRLYLGDTNIVAIAFNSDGMGWFFDDAGIISSCEWFMTNSLLFYPLGLITENSYSGGTSSLEYDSLRDILWWANGNQLCTIDVAGRNVQPTPVTTLGNADATGLTAMLMQHFPSGKNEVLEAPVPAQVEAQAQAQICEPMAAQ